MNDDEIALEATAEGVMKVHRRHAGATVKKKEDRAGGVLSAGQDPLIDSAEFDLLQRGDSIRDGVPAGVDYRRRARRHSQNNEQSDRGYRDYCEQSASDHR
jgi:hypothetical protein